MPDGLQPFLFAYVTAIRPFLFLATARIRAVLRAVLRILGGKRIRRIRRNHLSVCATKKIWSDILVTFWLHFGYVYVLALMYCVCKEL